nr:MAG TPA: hypothetical protein [Bacteriophage sp.]
MPSPFSLRVCYFGYAGCRFTLEPYLSQTEL